MPQESRHWEESFQENVVPVIEHPLLEYHHSEGHIRSKKCVEEDINIIKSFIRTLEDTIRQEEIENVSQIVIDGVLDIIQDTDWIEEPKSAFGRLNTLLSALNKMKENE